VNCPKCSAPLGEGVRLCPQCGANFAVKKRAQKEPPPAPYSAPLIRGAALRSAWKPLVFKGVKAVIVLAVLGTAAYFGWQWYRAQTREWVTLVEQRLAVSPGEIKMAAFDSSFEGDYVIEVSASDAMASFGLIAGQVKNADQAASAAAEVRFLAKPAQPERRTGVIHRGAYVWVVTGKDDKQPANVLVKIKAMAKLD